MQTVPARHKPAAPPKVLLVAYAWSTLTEMPYLCKQAGCEVHVLCPSNNWAIKNAYFDRWIDAGDSLPTLVEALRDLARNGGYRYIMLGEDTILWFIYRERLLDLWPLLPIGCEAALPLLGKVGFSTHCQAHGIPTPVFSIIMDGATADAAAAALGYPLVTKQNYSNGGEGVRVIRDAAALRSVIDAHDFAEPLLAQRFIAGRQIGVEALFKHGALLRYACAEDCQPGLGPTTRRRYFPNDPRIGEIVRRLGASAQLHGFSNVLLLEDARSGDYYLIEADPRPNKWVPYARWFGCDFSAAFRVFLDEAAERETLSNATAEVSQWEVEHFAGHFAGLWNQDRKLDAVLHLLDYDRHLRYHAYDPVLLKAKMDDMRSQLLSRIGKASAASTRTAVAGHAPDAEIPINQLEGAASMIKIDNVEYDRDSLSGEARTQLGNIQFVDQELARLQAHMAALRTARAAYAKALKSALSNADTPAAEGR